MIAESCQAKDLLNLATSVAERLSRVHSVERAPAVKDYSLQQDGESGRSTRVVIAVDLGRGFVFPVHANWQAGSESGDARPLLVERLSGALSFIYEEASELKAVYSLVKRRIAKASDAGIDYRLVSLQPLPLDADPLPLDPGRQFYAAIEFELECIDDSLRTARFSSESYSRNHLKYLFDISDRAQVTSQKARALLARHKATAAIDRVLLNALRQCGVVDTELLHKLNQSREDTLEIVNSDGTTFRLRWENGFVKGAVALGDGVFWRGGELRFDKAPRNFSKRNVGKRLVDIYPHPLLVESAVVLEAWGKAGGPGQLNCSLWATVFHLGDERFIEGTAGVQ